MKQKRKLFRMFFALGMIAMTAVLGAFGRQSRDD